MRLVRLYTNEDAIFEPIDFHPGLNVVIGEIRQPENLDKDTHNLGKSTLGKLIDYCLLMRRDSRFFLYKHAERFEGFDFYLEVMARPDRFVTIRRSVRSPKIYIHNHSSEVFDARALSNDEWLHPRLDFEKAKKLLDGILSFEDLRPWSYRKILPYLLREQSDYTDVFEPHEFRSGSDSQWKPFTLHVMGYDYAPFQEYYDSEQEKADVERRCAECASSLPDGVGNLARIDALLDAMVRDAENKREVLDRFSFNLQDSEAVDELVDDEGIDAQIAELNQRRYELKTDVAKLTESLQREQIGYRDADAARLFEEVGIYFEGQVRKDFQQLLEFNRAITSERKRYLRKDLEEVRARLCEVDRLLAELDSERSRRLRQIETSNAVEKYKEQSQNLVRIQTEIGVWETRRENAQLLEDTRQELNEIEQRMLVLAKEMRKAVTDAIRRDSESLFLEIRRRFSDIVKDVLNKYGVLTVTVNTDNHADFAAGFQGDGDAMTSEDEGDTYKKLLCIAFDLAILGAHGCDGFPSFVYHDDVFGSLDLRKKMKLLDVMRAYADEGVQQIVTTIDSDLPISEAGAFIAPDEIVLRLHDGGESGLLFKMPSW